MIDETSLCEVIEDNSGMDTIANLDAITLQDAWMGSYSLNAIAESIEDQFNNYSHLEDTINYVDIFYDQLDISKEISTFEPEINQSDYFNVLNKVENDFISMMLDLFSTKLNIEIVEVDSDNIDYINMRNYIYIIYTYFIINSISNFTEAITNDYLSHNTELDLDDEKLFSKVYSDLDKIYSPIITFGCDKFLDYTINKSKALKELWDNTLVTGNFLNKYTPRLYRNEDLHSSITTNIIQSYMLKKGIELNGS